MLELFAARRSGECFPQARLKRIWYLDADATYQVRCKLPLTDETYIAVRTLTGRGTVRLQSGEFTAAPNTLLFFRSNTRMSYGTDGDTWRFYWFEFSVPHLEPELLNRIFRLSLSAAEQTELERCFSALRGGSLHECAMAEALFNYLLADWRLQTGRPDASAKKLLRLLEQGRSTHTQIPELAREAGMCERSFRNAVHAATGLSPKDYMLKNEMAAAMELLRTTRLTITEISERFHYSSSLYFSRVFKKYYGFSPQCVRDILAQEPQRDDP